MVSLTITGDSAITAITFGIAISPLNISANVHTKSSAVIGAIICIAALYVSVNMLISENRHNISMLKVLGLKNREINRMIIDVNHIIIPFGIAVGMLTGYFMMVVVFRIYSGMEGVLYTPVITAQSIILTIVIVIACYAVSLLIVRRKADRVDMVESLKDNRE